MPVHPYPHSLRALGQQPRELSRALLAHQLHQALRLQEVMVRKLKPRDNSLSQISTPPISHC